MKQTKLWHILVIFCICLVGLLMTCGCSGCGSACEACGSCATDVVCGTCETACTACGSCYECSGCAGFLRGCGCEEGCLLGLVLCI